MDNDRDPKKSYILWGSAGHAKVLASLIALHEGQVIALFDNNPNAASALEGIPLFISQSGFLSWISQAQDIEKIRGLAAIGGSRGSDRLAIHQLFRSAGILIEPIIHPTASVCQTASLGEGTQVLAQAIVAADAWIGEGCIINHRSSVDHECFIGDGVHLAPGVTLCGCVKIGKNVMIGAGAVLLPRLIIGDNSIIGAGSVVTHNIPEGVVAFGNPAKIKRQI